MTHEWVRLAVAAVLLAAASGCGGARDPVQEIQRTLASAPEYTLILEDMREEGMLFPRYYHKYRVVQPEIGADSTDVRVNTAVTDWVEVSEANYQRYEPFLGMALASKSRDGVNATPHPPGYDQVGDSRYGRWESGPGGGSFWVWYGQYALMRGLMGWGMQGIGRSDWDSYRGARGQRPYYGEGDRYGTGGSVTRAQKPTFFERRQQRMQQSQRSFAQQAQRRMGRSSTGFGSRGRGFGK